MWGAGGKTLIFWYAPNFSPTPLSVVVPTQEFAGGWNGYRRCSRRSSLKNAKNERKSYHLKRFAKPANCCPKLGFVDDCPEFADSEKWIWLRVISLGFAHVSSEATSFVLVCSVCRSSGLFSSLVVLSWTNETMRPYVYIRICIYIYIYIYILGYVYTLNLTCTSFGIPFS